MEGDFRYFERGTVAWFLDMNTLIGDTCSRYNHNTFVFHYVSTDEIIAIKIG